MAAAGGSVDLIIKNPSLPDAEFRTTVPLASSVRELKEQLQASHPCKPLVDEQCVIFAGKILQDAEGLQGHMARHDTSVPITLHLVIRRASAWMSQSLPAPPAPEAASAPPLAPAEPARGSPPAASHAGAPHGAYLPHGAFRCTGYQYVTQLVNGQPYVFAVPTMEPLWLALPVGAPLPPGAWLAPGIAPPGAYPVLTPTAAPFAWPDQRAPFGASAAAAADDGAARGAEPAAPAPAPAAPALPAADNAAQVAQRDALQLAMKLALLVFMLGQDGDIDRLLLLCTIAVAIFVAQTHNLAHLLPTFRAPAALGGAGGVAGGANGGVGAEPHAAGGGTGAGGTLRFCVTCCVAFVTSLFPGYPLAQQPEAAPHLADGADGADGGAYGAQGPADVAGPAEVPGAAGVPGAEPAVRVDAREE